MAKTIHSPAYGRLLVALRARRIELGLSQRQAANRLGMGRTWLGKIEQGDRRLDALELYRLCRLYEVQWADIEPLLRGHP
jgi:transcriptional regulator with XRE-family HTH domain